jgi:hypothetical protein
MGVPRRDLPGLALVPFCFDYGDGVNGGEELNALSMSSMACTPIHVARCVLPVPGPPDQHGVVNCLWLQML